MIFFLSIFLLRSSIILQLDIILVIDYKLDVGLEGDQMMVCCVLCVFQFVLLFDVKISKQNCRLWGDHQSSLALSRPFKISRVWLCA